MLTVILFLIILAILILSHEFGHFIVAKKSGIRVDEFGLGFPPRAYGVKRGETIYSLNWFPFGGFVKIFGENPDDESIAGPDSSRSLVNKPRGVQAAVLVAGVVFNILLAWLLITLGFVNGLPAAAGDGNMGSIVDPHLTVTSVLPKSPASEAGLKPGDQITALKAGKVVLTAPTVSQTQDFLASEGGREVEVKYLEGGKNERTTLVTPKDGLVPGKAAIGITLDMVGLLKVPFWQAPWKAALFTGSLIISTALGLGHFFAQLVTGAGSAALSSVTGPVGLVGLVGSAKTLGLSYLLSFTALISVNLAIINLIPFPALDGGRLLFLAIEAIKGSRINPRVANTVNMIGFALLIILMLVVTYSDIGRLFFHK